MYTVHEHGVGVHPDHVVHIVGSGPRLPRLINMYVYMYMYIYIYREREI